MSNTAKTIYFVLYDGVVLLDVAGPAEVFAQANAHLSSPRYEIEYVSASPTGSVMTYAGLGVITKPLPSPNQNIDMVIVPGADFDALSVAINDRDLMSWLAEVTKSSQRSASVCTGAFLLGRLGLLDDKRVTTHWLGAEALQQSNTRAIVEADTLYIEDDGLWTSAGVLAGVDMALAIVQKDLGSDLALKVARQLVVFLIRDGGQSQFSGPIDLQMKASRGDLLRLVSWIEMRLSKQITVEEMAEYMSLSVRTLHRKCQEILALTPARLVSELRLERGRTLLADPNLSIKSIALECGFASSSAFSKAFSQRFSLPPIKYQQRFQDKVS